VWDNRFSPHHTWLHVEELTMWMLMHLKSGYQLISHQRHQWTVKCNRALS